MNLSSNIDQACDLLSQLNTKLQHDAVPNDELATHFLNLRRLLRDSYVDNTVPIPAPVATGPVQALQQKISAHPEYLITSTQQHHDQATDHINEPHNNPNNQSDVFPTFPVSFNIPKLSIQQSTLLKPTIQQFQMNSYHLRHTVHTIEHERQAFPLEDVFRKLDVGNEIIEELRTSSSTTIPKSIDNELIASDQINSEANTTTTTTATTTTTTTTTNDESELPTHTNNDIPLPALSIAHFDAMMQHPAVYKDVAAMLLKINPSLVKNRSNQTLPPSTTLFLDTLASLSPSNATPTRKTLHDAIIAAKLSSSTISHGDQSSSSTAMDDNDDEGAQVTTSQDHHDQDDDKTTLTAEDAQILSHLIFPNVEYARMFDVLCFIYYRGIMLHTTRSISKKLLLVLRRQLLDATEQCDSFEARLRELQTLTLSLGSFVRDSKQTVPGLLAYFAVANTVQQSSITLEEPVHSDDISHEGEPTDNLPQPKRRRRRSRQGDDVDENQDIDNDEDDEDNDDVEEGAEMADDAAPTKKRFRRSRAADDQNESPDDRDEDDSDDDHDEDDNDHDEDDNDEDNQDHNDQLEITKTLLTKVPITKDAVNHMLLRFYQETDS